MSVAEGYAGVVDLRWSGVVVALSVREEAKLYNKVVKVRDSQEAQAQPPTSMVGQILPELMPCS